MWRHKQWSYLSRVVALFLRVDSVCPVWVRLLAVLLVIATAGGLAA